LPSERHQHPKTKSFIYFIVQLKRSSEPFGYFHLFLETLAVSFVALKKIKKSGHSVMVRFL